MKPEKLRILTIAVLSSFLLIFFVWKSSFDSIIDILEDRTAYRSQTAFLFGKTGPAYSVPFVGSLYKFSDTSGSMWVVSGNDSTTQGEIMYLEASVLIGTEKEALKLQEEFQKILDRKVFSNEQMPPILLEKTRGGIIASLKAVRAKK